MKRERRALALTVAALLALSAPTAAASAEAANAEAEAVEASAEAAEASTEASGSGWREGLGPEKPYEGVPEVDLSKRLGYIMYSPMNTKSVENGCQKLYVYLPRTDVKAGEGLVHLYEDGEESEEIWQSAMNDADAVREREMTEAEREILMWGDGTCFEIKPLRTLELGKAYHVDLDKGCICTEDGQVENPEVKGASAWAFRVEGEYGVSGMEYQRAVSGESAEAEELEAEEAEPTDTPEPTATPDPRVTPDPNATPDPELQALIDLANGVTPEPTEAPEIEYEAVKKPEPGNRIRFDLVLGGDAALAILYGHDGSVDFMETTFEESCEVTGEVLKENPSWGVMFMDPDGNQLGRVDFR